MNDTKTQNPVDARERELFQNYTRARAWRDDLKTLKSRAETELEQAEYALVTYMTDLNKKTVKYNDLGTITVKAPTPRPKFEEERRAEVFQFVRENGGGACIKEGIHPSTFSSFVKELLVQGREIPDCIEVFYQTSVVYTKPGEKGE